MLGLKLNGVSIRGYWLDQKEQKEFPQDFNHKLINFCAMVVRAHENMIPTQKFPPSLIQTFLPLYKLTDPIPIS